MPTADRLPQLERRVERLRALARAQGAGAVAVSLPEHVFYLTGHEPDGAYPARLLVTAERVRGAFAEPLPAGLPAWVEAEPYAGWEADAATAGRGLAATWQRIAGRDGDALDDALAGRALFRRLMRRKEPAEVAAIEANLRANDAAFAALASSLRPGLTGLDVAGICLRALSEQAGAPVGWDGCVGAGPRGDDNDAQPGAAAIGAGELVFVDLYPRRRGYAGDSTRTFVVGEPAAWMCAAHAALVAALSAAEALLRPGAAAADVDAACRTRLDAHGRGTRFGHHSGHGLGVFAQEPPYLVPGSHDVLVEGDVVAIEPGLYLPGEGGMRLEDAFEIVPGGARRLNAYPRELVICA